MSTQGNSQVVNNYLQKLPEVVNGYLNAMPEVSPRISVNLGRMATAVANIALLFFCCTRPMYYVGLTLGIGERLIHHFADKKNEEKANNVEYLAGLAASIMSIIGKSPFTIVGYISGHALGNWAIREYKHYSLTPVVTA